MQALIATIVVKNQNFYNVQRAIEWLVILIFSTCNFYHLYTVHNNIKLIIKL